MVQGRLETFFKCFLKVLSLLRTGQGGGHSTEVLFVPFTQQPWVQIPAPLFLFTA